MSTSQLKKFQISGHRKGPRPSTNTTSMYEKSKTHVNRTYSRTYWFNIYRFTYRYTVLLYTTCTDELFVCVHNSYKRDTHTHTHTHTNTHTRTLHFIYIDSCTDILYYCTQSVHKNGTSVYKTHINGTHTRTLHFIYID